jgi:threonine aldolase
LEKVQSLIKPIDDHHARTKLVCLENTTNGKVLSLDYLKEFHHFCKEKKLASHLDGARVFNAVVQLNAKLEDISQYFDSISICLSKGLGAPIGSVLCGNKDFIKRAKRWRKVLGGGMRQAGILAAAGIYALENNITRLKQDHENAKTLALELTEIEEISLEPNSLHTNMLFLKAPERYEELQAFLKQKGIIFPAKRNQQRLVRLVTHLDISKEDVTRVVSEIKTFYG